MDKNAEMAAYIRGIIQENKDHPPKVVRLKCSDCKKMNQRKITCPLYQPKNIPMDVLKGEKECPAFEQE